jgi:hypothetical protein
MNRLRQSLASLFLVVLPLTPASSQGQSKDDKKYAPMPWHLVDHWWDIGQDTPFATNDGGEKVPHGSNLEKNPGWPMHILFAGVET